MIRRPPRSTRTDTLFPYTTLFRSQLTWLGAEQRAEMWKARTPMPISQFRRDMDDTHYYAYAYGFRLADIDGQWTVRSEEHTSELQSLMRISYAVFCLKKKT